MIAFSSLPDRAAGRIQLDPGRSLSWARRCIRRVGRPTPSSSRVRAPFSVTRRIYRRRFTPAPIRRACRLQPLERVPIEPPRSSDAGDKRRGRPSVVGPGARRDHHRETQGRNPPLPPSEPSPSPWRATTARNPLSRRSGNLQFRRRSKSEVVPHPQRGVRPAHRGLSGQDNRRHQRRGRDPAGDAGGRDRLAGGRQGASRSFFQPGAPAGSGSGADDRASISRSVGSPLFSKMPQVLPLGNVLFMVTALSPFWICSPPPPPRGTLAPGQVTVASVCVPLGLLTIEPSWKEYPVGLTWHTTYTTNVDTDVPRC